MSGLTQSPLVSGTQLVVDFPPNFNLVLSANPLVEAV